MSPGHLLNPFWRNAGAPPAGDGAPETYAYTEDTVTDLNNPERGWYTENLRFGNTIGGVIYDTSPVQNLPNFDQADLRLELFYINLRAYLNTDVIDTTFLNNLSNQFAQLRAAGKKCMLRFAYNNGDDEQPEDTTLTRMTTHWTTYLRPVVDANKDVIAVLQGGFAGPWGEQWDNGTSEIDTWAERDGLIAMLMANTLPDMMVQWRAPEWTVNEGTPPPTLANRFDGSKAARMGHYNDCIGAGYDMANTYPNPDTWEWAYGVGPYTAMGGETCWASGLGAFNDASYLFPILDDLGLDYLNSTFWLDLLNKWNGATFGGESALSYLSKRIGYRLALTQAILPTVTEAGAAISVTFTMKNAGFGKVYNPRPIDLIFDGPGGPFTTRLTADARRDLPLSGETVTFTLNGTAPAGLVDDATYSLHLRLPDANASIEANPKYAIRLANTGMWNAATGRHDLGAQVTIGEGGGTTPPPSGNLDPDLADLLGVGADSTSLTDYPKTPLYTSGDYYVDGLNGNDANNGQSLGSPFRTIQRGMNALAAAGGGRCLVRATAVYGINSNLLWSATPGATAQLFGYGEERPIIDAGGAGLIALINFDGGDNLHVKRFELRNVGGYGLRNVGANNRFEDLDIHDTRWAAIYNISAASVYSVAQDIRAYRIGYPGDTGTNAADVFVCTTSGGPGNYAVGHKFVRCVGTGGPDDVFDLFLGREVEIIDCVADRAGYHYTAGNVGGDGTGFKLGGAKNGGTGGGNTLRGSFATGCRTVGVTVNGADPHLLIEKVTATLNERNVILDPTSTDQPHIVRDVLALLHSGTYDLSKTEPINDTFNTWNLGIANPGFANPGAYDWSLAAGSACRDAASDGDHLGASGIALQLAKTYLPILRSA